ncbi:hypothetical protein PITC_075660 [Penicillium italicum]|uniref:Uncharacterized protein n=1 Tax=Penicillium italicum TaxID=40296 RepID=A0A0A2KYX4_PENIT|nr:hypothetical protein PITC_075660 [Penicillium italicum]
MNNKRGYYDTVLYRKDWEGRKENLVICTWPRRSLS